MRQIALISYNDAVGWDGWEVAAVEPHRLHMGVDGLVSTVHELWGLPANVHLPLEEDVWRANAASAALVKAREFLASIGGILVRHI